jgi:hypothetical protein
MAVNTSMAMRHGAEKYMIEKEMHFAEVALYNIRSLQREHITRAAQCTGSCMILATLHTRFVEEPKDNLTKMKPRNPP